MATSPKNSAATATPLPPGGNASSPKAWRACRTDHARGGPPAFPPEQRAAVLAWASELPAAADCSATRWSLDDLARRLVNDYAAEALSRATIWRTLDAADLKPHKSVYWLNSHDPDFEQRAKEYPPSTSSRRRCTSRASW